MSIIQEKKKVDDGHLKGIDQQQETKKFWWFYGVDWKETNKSITWLDKETFETKHYA